MEGFGILSQFVCSHSTSKHLTAWIWLLKKYYSVKPLELPVFAYRPKQCMQLFARFSGSLTFLALLESVGS